MAERWTDWCRLRTSGAVDAEQWIPLARKQLGYLMGQLQLQELDQGVLVKDYGLVEIRTSFDGVTPLVEMRTTTTGAPQPLTPQLWIPEGFVVYPASDTAPAGWGLPVQVQRKEDGSSTDDDTLVLLERQNLKPGLDVARWSVGGALGQVLLSQAPQAGYPDDGEQSLAVPLLYDLEFGPMLDAAFTAPQQGDWQGYRIEFADFTNQSPGATPTQRPAITQAKRGIFQLTNEHRASIGRERVTPPVRGLFDSAQVGAEISFSSQVMGHMFERWPEHWRTSEDVIDHDGARLRSLYLGDDWNSRSQNWFENAMAGAVSFEVIGHDANGSDIVRVDGGVQVSAQAAFDSWMGSAEHKANIEQVAWDAGAGPAGSAASTQIGVRVNMAKQQFLGHDAWLYCGTRQFVSDDPAVPVVSWDGPGVLNTGFESWGVRIRQAELLQAATDGTLGLDTVPFEVFQTPFSDDPATHQAGRSRNLCGGVGGHVHQRSPFVYSRGRIIAIAPNGEIVLAAGVYRVHDFMHRLMIISWSYADNADLDLAWGQSAYVRFWWINIPARDGLALAPEALIRGVWDREAVEDPWPWVQIDNPWSWRGGDRIDVGSTDGSARDALKYASQWVFAPDGTQAACLRDTGTLADYLRWVVPFDDTFNPPAPPDLATLTGAWHGVAQLYALQPTLWTLDVAHEVLIASATASWQGACPTAEPVQAPAGAAAALYPSLADLLADEDAYWFTAAEPLAVDYAASGHELIVAKQPVLYPGLQSRFWNQFSATQSFDVDLSGLGPSGVLWGDYAATLDTGTFTGWIDQPAAAGRDGEAYTGRFSIINGARQAFVQVAVPAVYAAARDAEDATLLVGDVTDWWSFDWRGTDTPCVRVALHCDGERQASQLFPNPDGFSAVPPTQFCALSGFLAPILEALPDAAVATSWAVDRAGHTLFSVNYQPHENAAYASGSSCSECRDRDGSELCHPSLGDFHIGDTLVFEPRGGLTWSDLGDSAELNTLAGTAGENPRFLYARAL
ncbi:MAG TPA: hypothetical protein VFG73_02310 [Rhodanobacteraceae bacterium]|nr:hypothetical protein [Rhodanobacteraceae bacterium]